MGAKLVQILLKAPQMTFFLRIFIKKLRKILVVRKKVVPLQPQIRNDTGCTNSDWGMV